MTHVDKHMHFDLGLYVKQRVKLFDLGTMTGIPMCSVPSLNLHLVLLNKKHNEYIQYIVSWGNFGHGATSVNKSSNKNMRQFGVAHEI